MTEQREPHGENGHTGGSTSAGGVHRGGTSVLRGLLLFLKEVVIVVVLAVVLSLIAKTWLVQSFWIPSASMNTTLVRDDRVIVSKLTPGPFALGHGDIVVFEDPGGWLDPGVKPAEQTGVTASINHALTWVGLLPEDKGNHLIKRVIGLPGDRVQCCSADGRLIVNGTAITEPYVNFGDEPSEINFDITVPAGKVWVMGDHRSDSRDSRYQPENGPGGLSEAGTVPIDRVVGRAFAVVWPLTNLQWLGEPKETFAKVPVPSSTPTSAPTEPVTPTP
ncbi:signal peptidase I [Gephyromycinifex aptenodytis]|uniref:signal peptidase I n=1 Tax=Gephyromycinifex aptenodytis TaxID=2716227 RepID=UPI00144536EA|nr:signal peptidase I [Gephyromycinifex aptenodytis]